MANKIDVDDDLVLGLLDEEEKAVEDLYNKYALPVFHFLKKLSSPLLIKEDIEEIIIDTIKKVYKKINQFDSNKSSFKSWVFTIAKNTLKDYWKKLRNELSKKTELKDNILFEKYNKEIPNNDPRIKICKEALDSLPKAEKELIIADLQMQAPKEVNNIFANSLKLTKSNIRVRKHRAYEKIRKFIREKGYALS